MARPAVRCPACQTSISVGSKVASCPKCGAALGKEAVGARRMPRWQLFLFAVALFGAILSLVLAGGSVVFFLMRKSNAGSPIPVGKASPARRDGERQKDRPAKAPPAKEPPAKEPPTKEPPPNELPAKEPPAKERPTEPPAKKDPQPAAETPDVSIGAIALPDLKIKESVFLDAPPMISKFEPQGVYGVLRRELVRQAFLMAAREEFGFLARDGVLREPMPEALAAEQHFQLSSTFIEQKSSKVILESGDPNARKMLLTKELPRVTFGPTRTFRRLIDNAETLARVEFVGALKEAGFTPRAPIFREQAPMPSGTQALLGEMTVPSQFAAVRQLHAHIRASGESREALAALARAYAHLGILTEHLWTLDHKVYKARALLYAQRLCMRLPQDPSGYWARAYAEALTGLHREADADLRAARQLAGTRTPPDWAGLIEPCIRFDSETLNSLAAKPNLARIARLLQYLVCEDDESTLTFRIGDQVLQDNPTCTRVVGASAAFGQVGHKHKSTQAYLAVPAKLPLLLAPLPHLPGTAKEVLGQPAPDLKLPKILQEAGMQDVGDLNWSGMGLWLLEERFLAISLRMHFMRDQWGVPFDEFVTESLPLVESHRYADVLRLCLLNAMNPAEQPRFREMLLKVPVADVDIRLNWLEGTYRSVNEVDAGVTILRRCRGHMDDTYSDLVVSYRKGETTSSAMMQMFSPHGPLGIAMNLEKSTTLSDQEVARWEKQESHQPRVLRGLGEWYRRKKRYADAERCYQAYLKHSPDYVGYTILAEVYRDQGKLDQMRTTLEEYLKQGDQDLTHAKVRVDIANAYMAEGKFKEAEPYAAKAAETWAGWAIVCAVDCYEGLDDWRSAEQWIRRLSERYPPQRFDWALWCKRTGKGDLDAAVRLAEEYVRTSGDRLSREEGVALGVLRLIVGKPAEAVEVFGSLHRANGTDVQSMLFASACDEAGMKKPRDEAWTSVKGKPSPFSKLVALLVAAGDKGELDATSAEKLITTFPAITQAQANYFTGRFLDSRAKVKEAVPFYQRCAIDPDSPMEFRTLATVRLRAHGVAPEPRRSKLAK